ncbi:MAG: winged helix-turn-helix transcriptional regulator [Victivallales bacterium]|nr:winged helix-turn-helix transcriptional regulator [Victivallales bacterium]
MSRKESKLANPISSRLDEVFEAWHSCDTAYLQLVRQWGISLNTVWALEYLVKHPDGVEPAVLAADTHMLRQTITVVLNDLEGRGYLTRAFHHTDRRRKIIRLTPTGQAFAQTVLAAISHAEAEAAATLSAEELKRLLDYSQRFSRAFARRVSAIILRQP